MHTISSKTFLIYYFFLNRLISNRRIFILIKSFGLLIPCLKKYIVVPDRREKQNLKGSLFFCP